MLDPWPQNCRTGQSIVIPGAPQRCPHTRHCPPPGGSEPWAGNLQRGSDGEVSGLGALAVMSTSGKMLSFSRAPPDLLLSTSPEQALVPGASGQVVGGSYLSTVEAEELAGGSCLFTLLPFLRKREGFLEGRDRPGDQEELVYFIGGTEPRNFAAWALNPVGLGFWQ